MKEGKKTSKGGTDVEEFKEIIAVFSEKVPGLIKGLISSVFSPEAAKDMGKAAATYYQELKAGGIPDDVAVKMTQDYVSTFSKVSDFIKTASGGRGRAGHEDDIGREIETHIKKRLRDKFAEDEKD
ncbi:hypothetical protein AUG19_07165 [archaeon 13_1_20CM_2_54_9]|nr:MAG: hypothetical protein AUJ07_07685 [Crenarchaeota archaeon 13_1_40CM_3_53_5]OLE75015.1 MAG: hypothetical protein AUG19_07165 [archaeon 13_1_20CM_2_54_9]